MDELSPLFQEIEFHERYRGYDPDEVDAFVDRVARAAAVMRGRIAELHERVDAAESRGAGVATHSDAEGTLTRTLVLAQRTADAAIAEAREEADRLTTDAATSAQAILSAAEAEAQLTLREAQSEASSTLKEADDRAGLVLAEAETDRRALVAEAESVAAEAAAAERERLAAEVAELHEYRSFLADDIEILERHLTEERHQLTVSVTALADLLDSPEAFRARRAPATSGIEIDEDLMTALVAAESTVDDHATPDEIEAVEIEAVDVEVADVEVADIEVADIEVADIEEAEAGEELDEIDEPAPAFTMAPGPTDDETIDLVAAETAGEPEPERAPEPDSVAEEVVYTEIDLGEPDPEPDPGPGRGPDPTDDGDIPSRSEPAYAGMVESTLDIGSVEPAPQRLVTAADLDAPVSTGSRIGFEPSTSDRAFDDGGPITQAVPMMQEGSLFAEPEVSDDPFLDQLRDAMENEPIPEGDDEALSAFFDQEDDDGGRSWFGRRR